MVKKKLLFILPIYSLQAGAPKPEYDNNKLVHASVGSAEFVKAEIGWSGATISNRCLTDLNHRSTEPLQR
jgi:hypothetical protein